MAKTDRILANDYHDFFIRGESFFYAVKTLFNVRKLKPLPPSP